MIKKLFEIFNTEVAKDYLFGEVGVTYDNTVNKFFLDKDIELPGLTIPVILYLETKDKKATEKQYNIFKKIESEFLNIENDLVSFLTSNLKGFRKDDLNKKYRIESITIPDIDKANFNWEIDLINMDDGFSHIVVEFEGFKASNYYVNA